MEWNVKSKILHCASAAAHNLQLKVKEFFIDISIEASSKIFSKIQQQSMKVLKNIQIEVNVNRMRL